MFNIPMFVLVSAMVSLAIALLVTFIVWAHKQDPIGTAQRAADAAAEGTDADPIDLEADIPAFRSVYFASIAVVVLFGLWSGLAFTYLDFKLFGVEWNVGYILWAVELAILANFFQIASPQSLTGVLVWGVPTIVVSGHPFLRIPGLHRLEVFSRSSVQMELPEEPEKIFRKEDVEAVPEGMVPPVRITFPGADPNDTTVDHTDPLNQRTTNEVSSFVRWRIRKFWNFYVRIQTLLEAKRQLLDMCVGLLQEKLTTMTVAQALMQLTIINKQLDNLVRERTKFWGVEIIDARIKLIGFSHNLNIAVQKIAEETAGKQSTIIKADAEEYKRTHEGTGAASAAKALAEAEITGRAKGMAAMAEALGTEGKDVLAAETARAIGEGPSNTFILGAPGITELAGLGAALAAKMADKPKETTAP